MQGQKRGVKLMSPRTGRPPIQDVSRSEKLNIRLTKAEKERIKQCSEELQLTQTDTIMKGISLIEKELKK
jgi:predicted aminopeptidase